MSLKTSKPMGVLFEWLFARFHSGRFGWPDDKRLRPIDYTLGVDAIPKLHTWEMCKKIIIDDTASNDCSYAEWITEYAPENVVGNFDKPIVAPATHFVSHAWGFNFRDFLAALRNFVRMSTTKEERTSGIYLWIDVFVVNQNAAARNEIPEDFWQTTFLETVNSIGHTIIVLDQLPQQVPTVLTRIWCIWELYSTVKTPKNRLSVALGFKTSGLGQTLHTSETLEQLVALISAIRTSSAEATVATDREKINKLISDTAGGHDVIDLSVQCVIIGFLFSMACATLKDDNETHFGVIKYLVSEIAENLKAMREKFSTDALIQSLFYTRYVQKEPLVWTLMKGKTRFASWIQNQLGEISCSHVEELNMSGFDVYFNGVVLDQLPKGALQLSGLKRLNLSGNKLASLPEEFGGGSFPSLKYLDLSSNIFTSFPGTLFFLDKLEALNFSNNRLVDFKDFMNSLKLAIGENLNQEKTIWPLLSEFDLRLNDNLENGVANAILSELPHIKTVLYQTTSREKAVTILMNRFKSQASAGNATESDVKEFEIIANGSEKKVTKIFYVPIEQGGAMHGWGKKAFVANLRLKEVFMTQMGFHRVYWERGDILKLGAPTSNEMGFQGGSRQTFEHGELRWQPGKGCYMVASGMQCD